MFTLSQAREQLTHEYRKSVLIGKMYPSQSKNLYSLNPIHFDRLKIGEINECSYLFKSTHGIYIFSRIFDYFVSEQSKHTISVCIIVKQGPMELLSNSALDVFVNHLYPEPVICDVKHLNHKSEYKFKATYGGFSELQITFIRNSGLIDNLRGRRFDVIFHSCPEGVDDWVLNFLDSRTHTLVLIKPPAPVFGKDFYAGS